MAVGKPLVEVALWLLVLCRGINSAFGSASNETKGVVLCNERERQALLKFKHALNASSSNALPSWVGDNCCRWEGVVCNNETWHVIQLDLHNISVPWQIGNISGLHHLDLHSNSLQIENLRWISNLSSLQYLDMASVNLSMVADWLQPINMIPSLSVLRLSSCGLRNFSTPLHFNLTSLVELDLSNNVLEGPILSLNFDFRAFVDFSSNRFVGPLPQNWSGIISFDLSNNFFSGPIDMRFGSTHFLFLSNNSLHGNISSLICNSSIVMLDLSRNYLTGQVPSCPEDFQSLSILDLSYNNLDGILPFFKYNLKWVLQLSHNNLSGVLPSSSMGAHSMLFVLDLSGNRLSGAIPRWLGGNTSVLVILNLRSNMFHGNIPPELSLLPSLQVLDLANNRLSGKIPTSFGNFTSLAMTPILVGNILPGFILPGGNSPIITYQEHLNLSNNNLSGRIPSGNQLQTLIDPSIYTGNYDLCGPPLPKPCSPEVVPQPSNTFHGEEEKDGTEHWLFYVVVALGFVAGFWLICGILIFSKTWRIAYFRFFDRLNERLDGFYVKMVATVMKKIKGFDDPYLE
ncbi:LRR receptor-like serine/threonine-protein kinase FLS2 [Cinnamomum micranthum f. kanehirae]|uniref:LRR receptor-like serine/threonine-protein kinase FLS2 n=1 Tax=Cinnamomum micranthum f. kanehirae TaxID=337451 RepID=A0A443PSP2_9MAGN|nr:LRR receptor-like serine/threonine-protein kinase FLS2 [Cinnamomum micranthum f. kanehirae]